MPTAKKTTTKKVTEAVKKVGRSDAAKTFMQLMSDFEAKNPAKFAIKKERLEAKLKSL